MLYTNEELGCSFELPERVTVRQQLTYITDLNAHEGEPGVIQMWEAGRKLIQDWRCEVMPDPAASLDELFDMKAARVVTWAGLTVMRHMQGLDNVPKN